MRYLPLTPQDREAMLAAIGAANIDELFRDVPEQARLDGPVDLPHHASGRQVLRLQLRRRRLRWQLLR